MRSSPGPRRLLAALGLCLAMSGVFPGCAQQPMFAELAPARVAELASLAPERPQGIGPDCSDRAVWSDPVLRKRLSTVTASADALLQGSFPAWSDDAYLDYSRTGSRERGEEMMNLRKAWLFPLVLAECAERRGRFLPSLETVLRGLSAQPSWTWPAHDTTLRNFRGQDFEVDLFAADLAHDLAQTLYMLGDQISPTTRAEVMAALEARIFKPMRRSFATGGRDHWWLQTDINWNPVCLKGVVGAALAVLPDRHDRGLFAAAGEHYVRRYASSFPADGYALEGPSYWNYGFSHFTALRDMLLSATGRRIELFADPAIRAIALYAYRIEMAPGAIAAFGDSARATQIDGFTRAYANEAFGLGMPHRLAETPIRSRDRGNASPIVDAALILFAKPAAAPGGGGEKIGLASYFPDVGVLVSRAAPGARLGVTVKAGGNGNHSHNDVGSYSIAVGGQQPTGDPGRTVYSAKTFGRERYAIRAINSFGHPVPVVAGTLQLDARKLSPKVLSTRLTDDAAEIAIDMSPAYAVESLRSLTRQLRHQRSGAETVTIEDSVVFAAPQAFEVPIIAPGDWKDSGGGQIALREAGQGLSAAIEASAPYDLIVERIDEEGLAFTRIGVRFKTPVTKGMIRQTFRPL